MMWGDRVGINSRFFTTLLSRDPDTQVAQDTTTSWTNQSTWLWVLRTDPAPCGLWELENPSQNASSLLGVQPQLVHSPHIHSRGDCLLTPLPFRRHKTPQKFNQALHRLAWSLIFIVSMFICWWSFPTMIPSIKQLYSTVSALPLPDPGMHHLPLYLTLSSSTWQWKVNSASQVCPHWAACNKRLIIWNCVLP